MPKPHILFRFHKSFDVCKQNIRLLRSMNPGTPIHGLYGGFGGLQSLPPDLTQLLDSLFALPFEDPQYNWQHGDICIRWWFKEKGKAFDFTHLCIAEWDMLYLRPLGEIYGGFERAANYVAISGTYRKMMDEEWVWICGSHKRRVESILEEINKEKSVDIATLLFGIFGGCVLCREYLERLAARIVRSYSNDEVRLSLYSALFGIPMIDNGILSDKRNMFFDTEIDIDKAIAWGAHIAHPVRQIIPDIEDKFR